MGRGRSPGAAATIGTRLGADANGAQDCAGLGVRAFVERDFREHAVSGRRDFDGDLVRFNLDNGLVALDPVTDLPQPFADNGFRAFLLGGHFDVDEFAHRSVFNQINDLFGDTLG